MMFVYALSVVSLFFLDGSLCFTTTAFIRRERTTFLNAEVPDFPAGLTPETPLTVT